MSVKAYDEKWVQEMVAQRDQLLSAAKAAFPYLTSGTFAARKAIDGLRAAIAAAESKGQVNP